MIIAVNTGMRELVNILIIGALRTANAFRQVKGTSPILNSGN